MLAPIADSPTPCHCRLDTAGLQGVSVRVKGFPPLCV
jgi:hypothetical protein